MKNKTIGFLLIPLLISCDVNNQIASSNTISNESKSESSTSENQSIASLTKSLLEGSSSLIEDKYNYVINQYVGKEFEINMYSDHVFTDAGLSYDYFYITFIDTTHINYNFKISSGYSYNKILEIKSNRDYSVYDINESESITIFHDQIVIYDNDETEVYIGPVKTFLNLYKTKTSDTLCVDNNSESVRIDGTKYWINFKIK